MSPCAITAAPEERDKRSSLRYKRIAFTTASSICAKAVVLIAALITVPMTLHYLGPERYGLWMTLTSLVLFLTSADLGIGNGLTITLAEADGADDQELARQSVSSGFFALAALATCVLGLLAVSYGRIRWDHLYNTISALASREAGVATTALIACTAISLPIGIVSRVQLGYQKGYLSDLWLAFGNCLSLIAILIIIRTGVGLPWLVVAVAGCPVLTSSANWIVQFCHLTPTLRPSLGLVDRKTTVRLLKLGSMFFVQQCLGLTYYLSDNLIISHMLGSARVAEFAVVQRLFSIGLLSQYIMLPMWPACREAMTRGDTAWADKTLRHALRLNVMIGGGGGVVLLLASRWLLYRWAHVTVPDIDALRLGFAAWIVVVGYIAVMNAFLNQPGVMKRHLFIFGTATVLAVLLKPLFLRHWGSAGVVWATVAAYSLAYVIPAYRLAKMSIRLEA